MDQCGGQGQAALHPARGLGQQRPLPVPRVDHESRTPAAAAGVGGGVRHRARRRRPGCPTRQMREQHGRLRLVAETSAVAAEKRTGSHPARGPRPRRHDGPRSGCAARSSSRTRSVRPARRSIQRNREIDAVERGGPSERFDTPSTTTGAGRHPRRTLPQLAAGVNTSTGRCRSPGLSAHPRGPAAWAPRPPCRRCPAPWSTARTRSPGCAAGVQRGGSAMRRGHGPARHRSRRRWPGSETW